MNHITLYYRGELKSNGDAKHKHEIRKVFHPQLKKSWHQSPLSESLLADESSHENFFNREGIRRAGILFIPWIIEGLVELEITLLRPGSPGQIVTGGGDIDNRLKTIFDALQIPDDNQAKKVIDAKSVESEPFYCLMRDDKIISDVRVKTAQFLATEDPREVVLIVNVTRHGSPLYIHTGTAHYLI